MVYKYLIFVLILLLSISCSKKETTSKINGIVTNLATGLPEAKVFMELVADDYLDHYVFDTISTNSNGEYSLSVTGKDVEEVTLYANKKGFASYTFNKVPIDQSNYKNISLSPLDSYIRFHLVNKLNYDDSFFGVYWSNTLKRQRISPNTTYIYCDKGKTFDITRPCTGDNFIKVTWNYFEFDSSYLYPHLDSIYVNRGDTAVYIITM